MAESNTLWDIIDRAAREVDSWPAWKRAYVVEPYVNADKIFPGRSDVPKVVDIRDRDRYRRADS